MLPGCIPCLHTQVLGNQLVSGLSTEEIDGVEQVTAVEATDRQTGKGGGSTRLHCTACSARTTALQLAGRGPTQAMVPAALQQLPMVGNNSTAPAMPCS